LDQNIQEQEARKAKYEADKAKWAKEKLALENLVGKKDDEILDLQHANESLTEDRDKWKKQAHAANKVQQAEKKTKEAADFESEFLKLQAAKGININQ
jgi:hypothetical protein